MNKLFTSFALILIAGFASNAIAEDTAPVQITSTQTISELGTNTDHACSLLGETVRISLSSDVVAAFSCIELDSAINIGTCHTAGQRATRNVDCVATSYDASGNPDGWNATGCSATVTSVEIPLSYTGYIATSTGGSVADSPLAGVCDDAAANLLGLSIFN